MNGDSRTKRWYVHPHSSPRGSSSSRQAAFERDAKALHTAIEGAAHHLNVNLAKPDAPTSWAAPMANKQASGLDYIRTRRRGMTSLPF